MLVRGYERTCGSYSYSGRTTYTPCVRSGPVVKMYTVIRRRVVTAGPGHVDTRGGVGIVGYGIAILRVLAIIYIHSVPGICRFGSSGTSCSPILSYKVINVRTIRVHYKSFRGSTVINRHNGGHMGVGNNSTCNILVSITLRDVGTPGQRSGTYIPGTDHTADSGRWIFTTGHHENRTVGH